MYICIYICMYVYIGRYWRRLSCSANVMRPTKNPICGPPYVSVCERTNIVFEWVTLTA